MRLKRYLEKEGLTQRQFADKIGCTTAFLNGILNGKNTDIKISLLLKLHKASKIPLPVLIRDLLSSKKAPKAKKPATKRRRR